MFARRAVWLGGALAALLAVELAHSEPASPPATTRTIYVIMKDFLGSGQPATDERNGRVEAVDQNFALVERELPHFDMRALLHENLCRDLAGSPDPACSQVVIMDRPESAEARRLNVGHEGALIVTFAFEYLQGIGADGLRVIAALGTPRPDRPAEALIQVWYMTVPPKDIRASPLVAAEKASPKQKVSRAWWWAGTPSRIETELRRGIADIAGIARAAIPHLDPDAPGGLNNEWLLSLPRVSELKSAGKTDCRGVMCDFRVVGVSEDRYWWGQGSVNGYIISSIPLKPVR